VLVSILAERLVGAQKRRPINDSSIIFPAYLLDFW